MRDLRFWNCRHHYVDSKEETFLQDFIVTRSSDLKILENVLLVVISKS